MCCLKRRRNCLLCGVAVRNWRHCLVERRVTLTVVRQPSVDWTKNIRRCCPRTSRWEPVVCRWYFTPASSVADFVLRHAMQQTLCHRIQWVWLCDIDINIHRFFFGLLRNLSHEHSCLINDFLNLIWCLISYYLLLCVNSLGHCCGWYMSSQCAILYDNSCVKFCFYHLIFTLTQQIHMRKDFVSYNHNWTMQLTA